MIPPDRLDVLEAGLAVLEGFGRETRPRGRHILFYLGLRRMGDAVPPLGSEAYMPTRRVEDFMDELMRKRHRAEPVVVLTSPFGGSSASSTAPYNPRTGDKKPDKKENANNWRNNFDIQKGVGCPADPERIRSLLADPLLRDACPHMGTGPDGESFCSLTPNHTEYRGEKHSIWLRKTGDGCQVVDLDDPATYQTYLAPKGKRIPVFALIAALYCDAPEDVYPTRELVGIPDFAADFGFSVEQVESLFECDPGQQGNAAVLAAAAAPVAVPLVPASTSTPPPAATGRGAAVSTGQAGATEKDPVPLPELSGQVIANSGLGAELAVAADLMAQGWEVAYRGSQTGVGYDLEADRDGERLRVEVKSSVGLTTPELSESEWAAAQEHGDGFVLAIVDFYDSPEQAIRYVRDPAAATAPTERTKTIYRFPRAAIEGEGGEADSL